MEKNEFVILNFTFSYRLDYFSLRVTTSTTSQSKTFNRSIHNLWFISTYRSNIQQHVFPLMLLLSARTSVNESRSTRTALLHAILPDLLENPPPQGKICHCSLICWKTIRNYVKCTKKDTGVCSRGVERIPVRSHCEGSRFQQLTRRELSAGRAINFDYLTSSSTVFSPFFGQRSQGQCR